MELDKKQIKAIFIVGIAILIIILMFLIIAITTVYRNSNKNNQIDISNGFDSIKEIVEHYGCKYKNDTYEAKREYKTEINLEFSRQLYENDISNEEFYNSIIEDLAKFLRYSNFKMIDMKNDIIIEVICKDQKIFLITINGIEDYFIYMDSQLELTKFKEIKTISFNIEAPEIQSLIDNGWSTNIDLGTRESIFQTYNLYKDEGFKVKKIGQEIYNIVFDENYQGNIVNGLKVGITLSNIENKLGTPAFKDTDLNVIGYKGKDIYVFFTKNQISIYRNKKYDYNEFWNLVDDFLEDKYDFKGFMNELTYIWNDYSEYTYQNDYLFISYPNRGVDVKLNVDNVSGIVLYNNINENLDTVKKYLKNTEFISRLQLDNIFEAEKRRISKEKSLTSLCSEFMKENPIDSKSMYYDYYIEKDTRGNTISIYFVSKDDGFVSRELNEPVDTYLFVNDYYFVYSVYGKGIYCYNLADGNKFNIVEGRNNYHITQYQDNILKYDNEEIKVEFY